MPKFNESKTFSVEITIWVGDDSVDCLAEGTVEPADYSVGIMGPSLSIDSVTRIDTGEEIEVTVFNEDDINDSIWSELNSRR